MLHGPCSATWVVITVRCGADTSGMATVTLRRSDLFPVGTSVGIYPGGSQRPYSPTGPTAAVIASATVDAAGLLTVTDAGIVANTSYVAYALVGGEHRYCKCRSTLDLFDPGKAVGTGDTTNASTSLANVSASSGAFQIGQRVTGPGIPPGTFLLAGSGASWTMSDKATASATGVALEGHGAYRWRARLMRRRAAIGTS